MGVFRSFAFQGTNAHAVCGLPGPGSQSSVALPQTRALRPSRQWLFTAAPHALAWQALNNGANSLLEVDLGSRTGLHAPLWDHMVSGRHLFPASGFLELACGAARALGGVELLGPGTAAVSATGVSITLPLILPSASVGPVTVRAEVIADGGRFQVTSTRGVGVDVYVSGRLALVFGPAAEPRASTEAIPLVPGWPVPGVAFAALSSGALLWDSGFWSPPAALDGSLHLGAVLAMLNTGGGDRSPRVPAAVGTFSSAVALSDSAAFASAAARPASDGNKSFSSHRLAATSFPCLPCAELLDMETSAIRRWPTSTGAPPASFSGAAMEDLSLLYLLEWQAVGVADGGGCGGPGTAPPSRLLSMTCDESPRIAAGASAGLATSSSSSAASASLGRAVDFLQSLGCMPSPPSLALSMRHGHPSGSEASRAPASLEAGFLLQGLLRTASQELLGSFVSTLDVDARSVGRRAASALGSGVNGESSSLSRWSERGASAHVARLLPCAAPTVAGAVSLFPSPRGSFAAVLPRPASTAPSIPGLVELSVRAVGLNFRDVLNVLGMDPGDPVPASSIPAGYLF